LLTALAIADFNTLIKILAAFLGVNCNILNASSTGFHLTNLATNSIFLSEISAYLNVAVIPLI
jgi:hypothetical protein